MEKQPQRLVKWVYGRVCDAGGGIKLASGWLRRRANGSCRFNSKTPRGFDVDSRLRGAFRDSQSHKSRLIQSFTTFAAYLAN